CMQGLEFPIYTF
nr:immunoglobulin light chain junction region [Macaca mulatta]MOW14638.1 immunoglobulin light chain junction region [Macaca mulatta]